MIQRTVALEKEKFINVSKGCEEVHQIGDRESLEIEERVGLELGASEHKYGGNTADDSPDHEDGHHHQI